MIIKPLYDEVKNIMHSYIKKIHDMIKEGNIILEESRRLIQQDEMALVVIGAVMSSKIHKATLKYIAPNFGFNTSIMLSIGGYDSGNSEDSD